MGGSSHHTAKDYPLQYLAASALAATLNYPLWRASAVGQSGFVVSPMLIAGRWSVPAPWATYVYAFLPPYKGGVATVLGMTWARAAIFWGSDYGRMILRQGGYPDSVASVVPPLVVSTVVQCINMPLVRATITLQNPQCQHNFRNVTESMIYIYQQHGGVAGLWHGTSAGILKSVPKYCTAVVVKDVMDETLPPAYTPQEKLYRSALKSAAAGVAGAALTNPLDVIRNEMFKTNKKLSDTILFLYKKEGWAFLSRGLGKNLVAVSIPVACTIFFTDTLIQWTTTMPTTTPLLMQHRARLEKTEKDDGVAEDR